MARKAGPEPAGAPTALARAQRHPPSGSGLRCRATRWRSTPLSRRPLPPVGASKQPSPPPPPKPQRPRASPRTSRAWKPAGVPVPPTPRRPSPTLQAGGRDGGAARRASGALRRSPLVWKQSPPPTSGGAEAVRRRRRHPRSKSATACSGTLRPAAPPRTRRGGPSWPPQGSQQRAQMPSGARHSKSNIARWNRAGAGSRILPPSPPCGGRTRTDGRPGHAHGRRVARVCGAPTAGASVAPRP